MVQVAVKTFMDTVDESSGPWEKLQVSGELVEVLRSRSQLFSSPGVVELKEKARLERC